MQRYELAQKMIREAGERLREARLEPWAVQQKTGHQDLVTRWDAATEQFLRQEILTAFPEDAIVGEEYPNAGSGGVTWYLDPIDGTTNFINQRRNYAISMGCWQGKSPLFGLVLDVERQELYAAESGQGAWREGQRLHVSTRREIGELLVVTPGVLHTFLEPHPWQAGLIRLARDVRAVRCQGSVALELCAVAAGEADAFVTLRSSPWDHNAARIILKEAGGTVCTLEGVPLPLGEKSTVLAANSTDLQTRLLANYCCPEKEN